MNISAIQTFLSVVRTRNLNRAAEEMNVTQSAVSARLDGLEQALGAQLLIRSRKGATLTKEGFTFLEQAQVIARSWDNARTRISLPHGVTTVFSLACDPGLWTGLGQDWADTIRVRHPDTALEVWTAQTSNAQSWLQSGMCDAALLTEPLTGPQVVSRPFATCNLIQVSSRPRKAVEWHPDYIYVDYGASVRAQHTENWPSDESASVSFSNPDWAMSHLLKQGGSAYLPEQMTTDLLTDGALHRVENAPPFQRQSHLTWRKDRETRFPWLPHDIDI
ncbi:Hca operon transcriptional activator [Falsiruegeria litorea R37]|uniref:Hca operon transcriptional activator n=1 Tax=Falsiruegeria litorea R37 TaxID=1200284 RepID=A0A1Y5TZX7_9RHOB|nr:LysR family transcriptional regulator [Falsiruegeria litorea]SLN72532.1 Hca operon transcriptional activator [Falsiruegeria litorea R37]